VKIVHYMASIRLSDGGVVRATLDMSEALAAAGHDFTLITAHTDDVPDEWREGGSGLPRVVGLEPPLGRGRLLKKHHLDIARDCLAGADVLHMHTPWELGNLQFARLAREAGIPYVISIHGMLDDWAMAQRPLKKRTFHAAFARRLLSGAALVHCTAESELKQSDRWFGGATGRVVPLVMDFRDYTQLPGTDAARSAFPAADADDPIVLFLSRVHPGKGLENLLGAARTLLDEGRRLRLLVAGTGEQWYVRAIQQKARELELGDACHFLGMVRGIEKVSLYEAADIFVLSSEHENFGLVIPEALASGTPVIASKGVSIWPELEAGGGSIIAPETAGGIADAVRTLLDDPDRRRAMGERGRAWILEFLDKQRITGEYERMYRDAAGHPAPTAREAAA
jgi:glycosyltransferase involved in cell wall biosynthesis